MQEERKRANDVSDLSRAEEEDMVVEEEVEEVKL